MTEEDIANLTPETKQARIVGSKWNITHTFAPEQCWSYGHYAIIEGCFNVSADLCLLLVGIPLLFKARIPVQQKLILLAIFGMGSFVIAAALLCKVYSLYPPLISYAYLNWFFREASVSVYVTNIPVLYSLIREAFPAVTKWGYTKKGSSTRSGDGTSRRPTDIPMKPFNRLGSSSDETDDLGPTQSQEHIISYNMKDPHALEIHKAVTFSVEKGATDDDDLEMGHHAQVPQGRTGSPYATTR
ncbi:MAG: hypothetical protein LQ351_006286 [Letrouitia transgressa]|nr:MAG: hypothetical protein LQ351_006286 [Letrouitia transgressa]